MLPGKLNVHKKYGRARMKTPISRFCHDIGRVGTSGKDADISRNIQNRTFQ